MNIKVEKNKIIKEVVNEEIKMTFLLPEKKPLHFKKIINKQADKSKILSSRDYAIAKEVFALIDEKKWIAATKSSKRVKN